MVQQIIKRLLIILIVSLSLLTTAITYTIIKSDQELIDDMAMQQMDNISQKIVEKIKTFLDSAAKVNNEISLFFYKKYLVAENREEILEVFDSFRYIHPNLKNIYFGTQTGKMIISPPQPPKVAAKYDPRKRPWYQQAMLEGRQIWTNVYKFASTGEAGITVAKPIIINNEKIGVLGVDINLKDLSHFLRGFKLEPAGYAFILDKNNIIIGHPLHNFVMKDLSALNININSKTIQELKYKKSLFIYDKNYFIKLLTYEDSNYNWTVGVVLTRATNVFNLRYVILTIGTFSIGILGIALFILWLSDILKLIKQSSEYVA